MFLLYVNDINNYLGSATCNLFADDVLLYCSGENVIEINDKLQDSLNKIKEWYDKNMLIVNASKSNAMLVTTRQKETVLTDDINLYFGVERLNVVTSFDYLGLKFDKNIRWDVYIESLCQELSKKIWILSRLREFLPFELLLNIYKSTIQPKIDYGISVWGFTSDMNLNRIQRLQNRAARAMYNNYDYVNIRGLDLLVDMKVMNVRQ